MVTFTRLSLQMGMLRVIHMEVVLATKPRTPRGHITTWVALVAGDTAILDVQVAICIMRTIKASPRKMVLTMFFLELARFFAA